MEGMGKQMTRCVVVGASSFADAEYLKTYLRDTDHIVAADGGLHLLREMKVLPHEIIGDFDSASVPSDCNVAVTQLPIHKDDTDVFAAVKAALACGYRDFLLLGCLGGRLDHTVSNLFLLRYLLENGAHGMLVDEHHEVRLLTKGTHRIPCRRDCYFSLLPYGGNACGVSICDAEYPLENATLDTVFPLGVSNGFIGTDVTVTVNSGYLLCILAKKD